MCLGALRCGMFTFRGIEKLRFENTNSAPSTSSMPRSTQIATDKVIPYWLAHTTKAAEKLFASLPEFKELGIQNVKRFQVFTVAETPSGQHPEQRRDNLTKEAKMAAAAPRGSYQYLFASQQDVNLQEPESMFKPIFRCPVDYDSKTNTFNNKWYSLLE